MPSMRRYRRRDVSPAHGLQLRLPVVTTAVPHIADDFLHSTKSSESGHKPTFPCPESAPSLEFHKYISRQTDRNCFSQKVTARPSFGCVCYQASHHPTLLYVGEIRLAMSEAIRHESYDRSSPRGEAQPSDNVQFTGWRRPSLFQTIYDCRRS
jgi:hypothetical protein